MTCKHCKSENEEGALFCSNCGKPIADEVCERGVTTGNTKLYIGISIALMVFLAGGLVFGFFYFSSKVQKANDERNTIASESDVAANYFRSQIREQEDAISALEAKVSDLEATIGEYEDQIVDYENQIAELQNRQEAMEGLASFTDAVSAQGYEDMFVSDTVLRLTDAEAVVRVCISGNIAVTATSDNEDVVTCSWDTTPTGPSVARLRVIPQASGTAVLTLTNDLNGEQIKIYVYVE